LQPQADGVNTMQIKHSFIYALLVLAFGIRVYGIFVAKNWFSHDESITYLAAAGKQEEFKYNYQYGQQIVPVSAYKDYYKLRHIGDLKNISRGMALTDNHPPLYWWLLHFTVALFGVHTWTGLILNLIFSCLLAFMTFKLALAASANKTLALIAACIFFISPTVNQIDYEARQYQVFALLAITFLYLNLKVHFNEVINIGKHYTLIFLVTVLGLLSHYYFGIVVFGAMILFLLKNGITKYTFIYFSVLLASLLAFFVLFPEFFLFIKGASENFGEFKEPGVSTLQKMYLMIVYSAEFFGYHKVGQVLFVLFSLTLAFSIFKKMRVKWNYFLLRSNLQSKKWYIFYMLMWMVLFTTLFFLMQLTPAQAIGEQYYSYIWPLLSITLAFLIYLLNAKEYVVYGLMSVMCVSSYFSTVNSHYVKAEFPLTWFDKANKTELFVFNAKFRSYLFRLAYFLDPNVDFYAGRAEENNLDLSAKSYDKISLFYIYDNAQEFDRTIDIINEKGYSSDSYEATPDSIYRFLTFHRNINAVK
jgi:hypothetical protein